MEFSEENLCCTTLISPVLFLFGCWIILNLFRRSSFFSTCKSLAINEYNVQQWYVSNSSSLLISLKYIESIIQGCFLFEEIRINDEIKYEFNDNAGCRTIHFRHYIAE